MKSFKKQILRAVAFVLIFLVLCSVCEFVLLQFEGNAYVTVRDLQREEDLDVVVIGNSEATRHFDPYLFQELTGKNSYNLSRFSSTVATQYTLMEQMFRSHKPEKVLVFFDAYTLVKLNPDTLEPTEESAFVQAGIGGLAGGIAAGCLTKGSGFRYDKEKGGAPWTVCNLWMKPLRWLRKRLRDWRTSLSAELMASSVRRRASSTYSFATR